MLIRNSLRQIGIDRTEDQSASTNVTATSCNGSIRRISPATGHNAKSMTPSIRINHRRWLLALLVSPVVAACSAPTQDAFDPAVMEERLVRNVEFTSAPPSAMLLADRMQKYGATAVSVALVRDGEIAWAGAYGSYSNADSRPVSPDTLFQAASLSKAVTALGVAHLVTRDGLDVDAPVDTHLESWQLPENDLTGGAPVTLRSLLSHSAGISVPSYPGFEQGEELPSIDDILAGRAPSKSAPVQVVSAPGKYEYSGGGYMILQKVIEDLTGSSLNEFMADSVFSPLGMRHTSFEPMQDVEGADVARGHGWTGEQYGDGWLVYPQAAPAGLWSTPTDLARILRAYIAAYRGKDNTLISPDVAREISKPVVDTMGLGFGAHGDGRKRHIDHAGWTRGYRSYLVVFPELGDALVVMTNGNGANRLIEEIVRGVSRELDWPAFKPQRYERAAWSGDELAQLVGSYRVEPAGFEINVTSRDDHLVIATPRGTTYEAHPIGRNELVTVEDGAHIVVTQGGDVRLSLWGMSASRQD